MEFLLHRTERIAGKTAVLADFFRARQGGTTDVVWACQLLWLSFYFFSMG
ncbi:MAG: hypothetical protein IJ034_05520 [Mailhella sp.]|nr:hypothetical protein [Mailhella sp.]